MNGKRFPSYIEKEKEKISILKLYTLALDQPGWVRTVLCVAVAAEHGF